MTKRDYVALATALNRARRLCETDNQRRGVERAAHCVADVLEAERSEFDRQRFIAAALGTNLTSPIGSPERPAFIGGLPFVARSKEDS